MLGQCIILNASIRLLKEGGVGGREEEGWG